MIPLTQLQLDAIHDDENPDGHYIDSGTLSLLHIGGEDADSFLQAQLSNDISQLRHGQCQLHAWCNPKGRALAILRMMRSENGFRALVPTDLVTPFTKRLKIFVMRSRVTIEIESDNRWLGFVGNPGSAGPDVDIYSVNESQSRYLLVGKDDRINQIFNKADTSILHGDYWRALDILAAIPQVYATTVEMFIPQNINLELIDGVSFKKGCYPGQEIIARIKYLGKSKKRLIIARVNTSEPLFPGEAIYAEGKPDSRAGIIVDSVGLNNRMYLVSVMVPDTLINHGALTVGSASGARLERIPMPYAIPGD